MKKTPREAHIATPELVTMTIAEIAAKGPQTFSAPPCATAFDEWWHHRRDKRLRGKALAKAAWAEVLEQMNG